MKLTIPTEGVKPSYATNGSAGMDLKASIPMVLWPGKTKLMPTGTKMAIPYGYEGQVRSRSGLALKSGIIVLNSPGTIDSDYRGDIGVILHNVSKSVYKIKKGDRIAQLVICPIVIAELLTVSELNTTERSADGYGSTGE